MRVFTEADKAIAFDLFDRVRAASSDLPGVTRPSYGSGETAALHLIEMTAQVLGLHAGCDAAANLLISMDDIWDPNTILIGSHLDSVPHGGNYDGLAGVVAGLLVVAKAKELKVDKPLVCCGFRGEESAWFGIPYIGAKAALGKLTDDDLHRVQVSRSPSSESLAQAMRRCGATTSWIRRGERILPEIKGYYELHIEQGPVLEAVGYPIGAVSGIRGNIRAPNAKVLGEAGHSGTTPHSMRKDAVMRFAELLVATEEYRSSMTTMEKEVVFTCGIVGTDPKKHSMTTIADEVRFSLDIRSLNPTLSQALFDFMEGYQSDIDWGTVVHTSGAELDPMPVLRAANDLGILCEVLPSGAGHDVTLFAPICPTGMVFVRNQNGSHNPSESMDLDDFMLGVETLYRVVTTCP